MIAVVRCRPWTHEGVCTVRVYLDDDGTVHVWDPIAGHYTTCHRLSERTCARIRREVG